MQWENSGIKLNGEFLSNLRFADDVVLINENIILLQKILSYSKKWQKNS